MLMILWTNEILQANEACYGYYYYLLHKLASEMPDAPREVSEAALKICILMVRRDVRSHLSRGPYWAQNGHSDTQRNATIARAAKTSLPKAKAILAKVRHGSDKTSDCFVSL